MSSPEQHGSSGFTDSDSSAESSGYPQSRFPSARASVPPGERERSYNFYTHPARTSVLNSPGAQLLDSSPATTTASNMANPARSDMASVWRPTGSLPSFSRAFDMFAAADDLDAASDGVEERFFVPSYLHGSSYIQRLEEAHKIKLQAQKDVQRPKGNGSDINTSSLGSATLPPGSHRGMLHTVLERAPFEHDDSLAPLPTRWSGDGMAGSLELQPDGLHLKYAGSKNPHDHEAYAVRADHFIPPQCGIYYYEVHIVSGKRDDTTIAIGFSGKGVALTRPVGWEPESWGYHGDDGRCFFGQNTPGKSYGPTFHHGDVVGCGINFRDRTAFFTRNGVKLGAFPFQEIARGNLYPAISLKKPGEEVVVNFGQSPFVYNIDDIMNEQREEIQKSIEATDTSRLEPGMSETDLIQTLVIQFLQHDGYVETARAFAEDMKLQKEALNLNPNVTVSGINIKDDEDANNRQRIRRAILEGDVDRALKYTNAYYPQVLRDNEQVYFKLRCRKFIEMVRKAAQLGMSNDSKRSNGQASQEMDLDMNFVENPAWGDSMDTDGEGHQAELMELEARMLEYGQTLQAEYAKDNRREIGKALTEIWALVAYRNPLKEPQVSHLLDRKGRVTVAEELNSAILSSLGKSSRASLEKLYAQTSVLLEDLRQDGGAGAFVSLQDVVDGIQQFPQI